MESGVVSLELLLERVTALEPEGLLPLQVGHGGDVRSPCLVDDEYGRSPCALEPESAARSGCGSWGVGRQPPCTASPTLRLSCRANGSVDRTGVVDTG